MALLSQHDLEHRDDAGQGRFSNRPPVRLARARPAAPQAHLRSARRRIPPRLPRHASDHWPKTLSRSVPPAATVDPPAQTICTPPPFLTARVALPPTAN